MFMIQLAIKWPFSFSPHPTSAFALPGKNRTDKICIRFNNKKTVAYKISSFRLCDHQQPINYKVWLLCSSTSI